MPPEKSGLPAVALAEAVGHLPAAMAVPAAEAPVGMGLPALPRGAGMGPAVLPRVSSGEGAATAALPPKSRRAPMQFVPIILGLVVIILAALVIRSMLGGKGDYEISFSTESIVVGETATATLTGMDANDTTEPISSGGAARIMWFP